MFKSSQRKSRFVVLIGLQFCICFVCQQREKENSKYFHGLINYSLFQSKSKDLQVICEWCNPFQSNFLKLLTLAAIVSKCSLHECYIFSVNVLAGNKKLKIQLKWGTHLLGTWALGKVKPDPEVRTRYAFLSFFPILMLLPTFYLFTGLVSLSLMLFLFLFSLLLLYFTSFFFFFFFIKDCINLMHMFYLSSWTSQPKWV